MNRYSNRGLDTSYIAVGATQAETNWLTAISAATQALAALAATALAFKSIATDSTEIGLADTAIRFATVSGPAGVKKAFDRGDGNELKMLQRSIANIGANVRGALKDAAVARFLLFLIPMVGPVAATLPASAIEKTKDAIRDLEVPPEAKDKSADLIFLAKVGLGLAGITWLAYVVKAFR